MIDTVVGGGLDTTIDIGGDSSELMSDEEFDDVVTEAMKKFKELKR
jgi:hypothetical protein